MLRGGGRLISGCSGHAATARFGEEKEHPPLSLPSAPGGCRWSSRRKLPSSYLNRAACKHGMDMVTKHGQSSPARSKMEDSPHIPPVQQLHCHKATKAFKLLERSGNLDGREVTQARGRKNSLAAGKKMLNEKRQG